jgi:iron complex outermembrane receptor protein
MVFLEKEDGEMKLKIKTEFICFLLILSLFFCVPLSAAEEKMSGDIEGTKVFSLGEVVVTGEAETITQVATAETINREQMDMTNSTDVSMALETMPGVHISVGSRNEAYLNVRGFNQRYVPIFYDGIPWYIPNDGYVDPSEIQTGNVSQITLTKGAASVLYGPNTMGGVINIISMKPEKTFEGSYSAEANENGFNGSLNLGSKIDRFYIIGGMSGVNNGDYRMSNDFKPIPRATGWYEDGDKRDNSDVENYSGSIKVGFTPADGHEYALGYHYIRSDERQLPPNIYTSESQRYWIFSDWEKKTYYFIGDSKITDWLSAKTRIYHDEYYNVLDSYDDANYNAQTRRYAFHSTYDDHTDGGSIVLRSDFIKNNNISFSFHYKKDEHKEQDDYGDPWERYEAKTFSYGLEDDFKLNKNLGIVIGASYDIQEEEYANGGALRDDDEAWNVLGGLNYLFEDFTKAHFSVAKKTRFPTLHELYSENLGMVIANPNLKKERSINYEVGVEKPMPLNSTGSIAFFLSDVDDRIELTTDGVNDFYDNIGEARLQGYEISVKTEALPRNILEANYTYLDAQNRSDDRTTSHLSEAPKYQLYISDLAKVTDRFSLFAKAQYNKRQWEEKRNGDWVELHSYWLVDVKAMIEVCKYATLELGVRNLFDKDYETGYGFPREGRSAFCGIRGSF